jgi:DNA-directed RNA polymerase specialized sigma24 family protein
VSPAAQKDRGVFHEREFIRELHRGDEHAWSMLSESFWAPLKSMVYSLCAPGMSDDDVEGILQDTLMGAFQTIDRFRAESSLSMFLVSILIGKVADFRVRATKREHVQPARNGTRASTCGESNVPRDVGTRCRVLRTCIAELMALQRPGTARRRALELLRDTLTTKRNAPTPREMARLWRCSTKAAKRRWFDAKRALKELYRERMRELKGEKAAAQAAAALFPKKVTRSECAGSSPLEKAGKCQTGN